MNSLVQVFLNSQTQGPGSQGFGTFPNRRQSRQNRTIIIIESMSVLYLGDQRVWWQPICHWIQMCVVDPWGDTCDLHWCVRGEDHRVWTFPMLAQDSRSGILFICTRSQGCNLWAGSDIGKGIASQAIWRVVLCVCHELEERVVSNFCLMNISELRKEQGREGKVF